VCVCVNVKDVEHIRQQIASVREKELKYGKISRGIRGGMEIEGRRKTGKGKLVGRKGEGRGHLHLCYQARL